METNADPFVPFTDEWRRFSVRSWFADHIESERKLAQSIDEAWQSSLAGEGAVRRWCIRIEDWLVSKLSPKERLLFIVMTHDDRPTNIQALILSHWTGSESGSEADWMMGTGDVVDALAGRQEGQSEDFTVRIALLLACRLLLDSTVREACFPRLEFTPGRVPERHVYIGLKVSRVATE